MKIDLKRLEGREFNADSEAKSKSVWKAYGFEKDNGHSWIIAAGAPLVIGGVCAAISWTAFVSFLAFCAAGVVLIGGAVAWIDSESHW